MNTPETKSFFTQEHRKRILDHMNEDHADAVLNYARYLADKPDATAARLVDIDQESIFVEAETETDQEVLRIHFTTPLAKPEDAHLTLVEMAKTARKAAAYQKAQETASAFEQNFKTIILGTCSPDGEPDASVAPAILGPDRAFYTFISDLSRHTGNILKTGRASALIVEDESDSEQLLARKRLTFPCTASEIKSEDPDYAKRMEDLKTKFGPVMDHLAKMRDFHLIRLAPKQGRLVNGFGQAYDVAPENWTELSHLSGKGHGHQKKETES